MKVNEILKIGKIIEIERMSKKKLELLYYPSKIEDIDEKEVYFWMPVKKGTVVPLGIGEEISINLVEKDGIYSFSGKIKRRASRPYPFFTLEYPEKLRRVQRRGFVRIALNLAVSLKRDEEKKSESESEDDKDKEIEMIEVEYKGVTRDLSGGGIYIMSVLKFKMEDEFIMNFRLTNGVDCVNIKSKIKRVDVVEKDNRKIYGYGFEFFEINDKLRENIISYLFNLQRERRKKGLKI